MDKIFKILIKTDDSQPDFLKMLPTEEMAISINFSKAKNISRGGEIRPYKYVDLLNNISSLIIDFHNRELVVFNEHNDYAQRYETLSLRGFLIDEVSKKLQNIKPVTI
jgi:hypothetical protein